MIGRKTITRLCGFGYANQTVNIKVDSRIEQILSKTPKLMQYNEVPPWQQESEYIRSGYRYFHIS